MSTKKPPKNNPGNGVKSPGSQMSAVTKAILGLVNLHPLANTGQLIDMWVQMGHKASDKSTTGAVSSWLPKRLHRLAGGGHVINKNPLQGAGRPALWHITAKGRAALGLTDTPSSTTASSKKQPATANPSKAQQQAMLVPRKSGITLAKTPPPVQRKATTKAKPAPTGRTCIEVPADTAAPDTPATSTPPPPARPKPALSPREQECAAALAVPSLEHGIRKPYTGIVSQCGTARSSLYGPNRTR